MTLEPLAVVFILIGMGTVIYWMLPIYEAIWYSLVTTLLVVCHSGWAFAKPRNWYPILNFFCSKMTSRLWGEDAYFVKQELDGWVFEPPFKIYRSEKK